MTQVQCDGLKDLSAPEVPEPKKAWPLRGEEYLYIDADLEIVRETWEGCPWEVKLRAMGNCFNVATEKNIYGQDIWSAIRVFGETLKPFRREP